MTGIALLGPPTAGKDTVTAALSAADPVFQLLTKVKSGSGRATGYRLVTPAELDELRAGGRLLAETRRYGNTYAVDRHTLRHLLEHGRVPVAHLGSLTDLDALTEAGETSWLRVLLWTPREVCAQRSRDRGDPDTPSRLAAWDALHAELRGRDVHGLVDLVVRTDRGTPLQAAARIADAATIRPSRSGRS